MPCKGIFPNPKIFCVSRKLLLYFKLCKSPFLKFLPQDEALDSMTHGIVSYPETPLLWVFDS